MSKYCNDSSDGIPSNAGVLSFLTPSYAALCSSSAIGLPNSSVSSGSRLGIYTFLRNS